MIYLISCIVFASVLLLAVALYQVLMRRSVVTERLAGLFPGEEQRVKRPAESGTWAYKLSRIGENVRLPPQERSKYARTLVAAGYRKESVYLLFGVKLLLTCLLPGAALLVYLAPRGFQFNRQALLLLVASAILGYLLPSYWLYAKKRARQLQIFHTLPDILDLVTVCVEAGLSMDAALLKASETPQFDHDPLAREIRVATMETRAGKPRIEALKDMADRTGVDDLKSFVTMLAQTERFGTSLSQALRSHADSLRTKRRQMAEEAAAKTTVKMVFPLVFFIMPALLVVILGPAIIQVMKIFK